MECPNCKTEIDLKKEIVQDVTERITDASGMVYDVTYDCNECEFPLAFLLINVTINRAGAKWLETNQYKPKSEH